jgi:hypothetical protein
VAQVREALVLALIACGRHDEPPPAPAPAAAAKSADLVPHTTGPIQIDGEWDEPDWPRHAFRAQFLGDDGQLARPSSELRMLRDDHDLIVALYAADENIETRDAFDLTVGPVSLHVDATAAVTPKIPGVRAKVGYDEGTLDNAKDDDEEWVVEVAIPLASTGKGHLAAKAARCDVPKDGTQRCGHWNGFVTIE